MGSVYVHSKKGIFIRVCAIKIAELKTEGVALRNNDTDELVAISDGYFKQHFKEVKNMTINKTS